MTDAPNGWPDPSKPGVPLHPERDGVHWLLSAPQLTPRFPSGMAWVASWNAWKVGNGRVSPEAIAANGWVYQARCLTPAEVAARVAEARREGMREAAAIVLRHTYGCFTKEQIAAAILAAAKEDKA
jgi:hypothetical protein